MGAMLRDCIAYIARFFWGTDCIRTISLSSEVRLLLEADASGEGLQSVFGYCMDDLKDATVSSQCEEACWSLSRKELSGVLCDFYRTGVCMRNENVLSFLLFCLSCYTKRREPYELVDSVPRRLLDMEKKRLYRILRTLGE